MEWYQYLIIIVILLIVALAIVKSNRRTTAKIGHWAGHANRPSGQQCIENTENIGWFRYCKVGIFRICKYKENRIGIP